MLEHGSAYEKAMATAFLSLDEYSQRKLLNDMQDMFYRWV